jgi:hypothetical protein
MRRAKFVAAVCLLAVPLVCSASDYVVPTTTLAAQTTNNTSAANSFTTQTNGNLGAANISKVDVHSLLYAGAQTKVYAHLLLWFGESKHMNVGYNSTDPAQIQRQVADMISRGIDGVIIDWYGPNNSIDQATQLVMAEAEKHPGFTFAIMIDQGAIEWDSCSGCSPQQALISQMQYLEQEYFTSPAYMTIQGQPVVTNFNVDLSYSVDWNAVNSFLTTHPIYLFQNNSGFSHILSGGSYSWVMPTTTDYGMSYLSSFYSAGMSASSEQTVGATYKGFNDSLASWGSNRIMQQQCGQTWLKTFSEINGIYSTAKELANLQLVTWNDYEEATEIESGIDNCVSLSASLSGGTLQWTITGNESTVDHYTAYISSDGQNLMPLSENQPGNRSVNLCSFSIPNGSYQLFVQVTGKSGLANHMAGAIPFTASCESTVTTTGPPPTLSFGASPLSISIPAGKSGTITVSAQVKSGAFNNPVTLTCANLPSTLTCSFSPAAITPGAGSASAVLTISAASVRESNLPVHRWNIFYATTVLPFGLVGFAFLGSGQRRNLKKLMGVFMLVGAALICSSCGGKVPIAPAQAVSVANNTIASTSASVPSDYSITIYGNGNSVQVAATVNVTVQ